MPLIELPKFSFTSWRRWRDKGRLEDEWDVPVDFGMLGLYLLARTGPAIGSDPLFRPVAGALPVEVIYIGMSTHVDKRLQRHHRGVARYRSRYADQGCHQLWYSIWESDWSNNKVKISGDALPMASLQTYERALILNYVQQHRRLPDLNKA